MGGDPIPGPHVPLVEWFEWISSREYRCLECYTRNDYHCDQECPLL